MRPPLARKSPTLLMSSDTGVPIGTSMLWIPDASPVIETMRLIMGMLSDRASQQASIVEQLKSTAPHVRSSVSWAAIDLP